MIVARSGDGRHGRDRRDARRVDAQVFTGCSVETNLQMCAASRAAVRQLQADQAKPEIRLVPVKGAIFGVVCEENFGAPGSSGDGLAITSATLAKALDEVYAGLQENRDLDTKHWLHDMLLKGLRSPPADGLPFGD